MDNILKSTKLVYSCFYDKDGHIQKSPTGKISRMKLPQTHLDFLYKYIEFIMNSRLLNEASIIYIKSPHDVVKGVFEQYNKDHPEVPINIKTGISNIDYNRRKMMKVFDEDMLTNVIYYPNKADIEKYSSQLESAMTKYNKGSIFKGKTLIDLPRDISTNMPSIEEINDFMTAIVAYRMVDKRTIEDGIKNSFGSVIAYFNYLSTCTDRDEEQEELWRLMSNFLEGKDF